MYMRELREVSEVRECFSKGWEVFVRFLVFDVSMIDIVFFFLNC